MIKTRGRTTDGTPVITLGLSRENMVRLTREEPIAFNLEELGLEPTHIILVGGENERAIVQQLEERGMLPAGTLLSMDFDDDGNPVQA